ncbi:MAG: carboxypeptidase regulatory-like domain-containing protein, partial [bacterium]
LTLSHPATNTQRTATTNTAGVYNLPALAPGLYTLKVEQAGFATQVRSDIELQVGQVARLDFVLRVGNLSEVVEVVGGAPMLQTETTALGTVIENKRILELPLNGRNYLQLASLIPGATTSAAPSRVGQLRMGGSRNDFTLNISGQRFTFNHYALDGIENTDINFNTYLFLPSIDALQEFKVESGLVQAEYGRATAQVNVMTRSGTNDLHATWFEFLRNSRLDAKNYFDQARDPIPPFKRNQFGFTVGGPVFIPRVVNGKDKLFFMFDYEGLRERKALTQLATVPFADQRGGDLSRFPRQVFDPRSQATDAAGRVISVSPFPGNIIPQNRIHPISGKVFRDHFPLPNRSTTVEANNFLNTEGRRSDSDQETARIDWVQSAGSSWFFRYSQSGELQYIPKNIPRQGNNADVKVRQGVLGNTRVFGPNKVNDFRFGVSRLEALNINTRAFKENTVAELGIADFPTNNPLYFGVPVFNISGFSSVGDCDDCPFVNFDTVMQAKDDFSWTRGKHSFKLGTDLRRTRFNQTGAGRVRG